MKPAAVANPSGHHPACPTDKVKKLLVSGELTSRRANTSCGYEHCTLSSSKTSVSCNGGNIMEWNEEAEGSHHICQADQQEETKNRTENQKW